MQLTIFGATGRTGRSLTTQALAGGHTVRALVRRAGSLTGAVGTAGVTEVVGDVLDAAAVSRAVAGSDAVLSTLGGGPPEAPGVTLSRGMPLVVAAMVGHGIRRVVALANAGILDAPAGGLVMDQPDFPAVYLGVTREHAGTWTALRESDREWTLACAPDLVDGAHTGKWRALANRLPEGGSRISTTDAASFMLHELIANDFERVRVGIAW